MEDSDNKKTGIDPFTGTVFSWSLEDIFNENLYKNQVETIPISFGSVQHYFGSYLYPLLEETRAEVHSSMETIDRAPFAEVVGLDESKPYGKNVYNIKVDFWRNRFNDRGKTPYKTLPGDLFVLADAKPQTVEDLRRVGRSWSFVSVTYFSDNENKDDSISLQFKVKTPKELEVEGSTRTSRYLVFLVNLIPNSRIWKSLNLGRNLKIIKEVLCPDYEALENDHLCYEMNDGIRYKCLGEGSSSGLNESQNRAVLACLDMLHRDSKSNVQLIWGPPGTGKTKTIATLLFTLLQMNCRTLVCAPTNVSITEVASCVVKMMAEAESDSLFSSFGEILLFGNKDRLKVSSDIEDIYLDYRIKRFGECLGPVTGWRSCFASTITFLEDCVSHYHIFLENESNNEKEQNGVGEMKEKGCRSETKIGKEKSKSFLEFFRERFVSTASPLRHCISTFCTHIAKSYISPHNFQNMSLLVGLVDSFESLLFKVDDVSESLEVLFSRSEVEDVPQPFGDDSFLLCKKRRKCLSVLRTLQDSLRGFKLPNVKNQESLEEFCFQRASLIFCTASSSYKLHRVVMEPLTFVVIDDAAQLKECESTIPLQLRGLEHAVLVGDECQLPATVISNVSDDAGFSRSLFERLSIIGRPRHLLNMQYRMHPYISLFPNSNFYNNQILDAPNVRNRTHEKHYLPGSMFGPYSFINVTCGREEKDEDGRSRKNMVEVAIVLKILHNLYNGWVFSKQKLSVGVVSPYAAQVVAIQDKLGKKYDKPDGFTVKVKTIDASQGGEEDIIILSTVRSNSHASLDFISKSQRVNVALTRARHCLWILGNERTLSNSKFVWEALVLDAKSRRCFFSADEDKDLAKAILEVKKGLDEFEDLLNADSVLFKSSKWKVLFSDNFLKSFKKLTSTHLKKSVLYRLLKLSSGWRPKKRNIGTIPGSSSSILRQYKVEGLYIICSTDIVKEVTYMQILKIWDILPLEDIPILVKRLDGILKTYTEDFINRCNEKCVEGDLEVPKSWPPSLDFTRLKDLNVKEGKGALVGNTSDGKSYVENSQVSESLLLMKFYSLSSGVVKHLLSDRDGRELHLPFQGTDEEMEIILYPRSTFIVGRSGTGKTTVLTMKLFKNERLHHLAVQDCLSSQDTTVEVSSSGTKGETLHQLFVTVSPKLCSAIKHHVLNLKRFACGGSDSCEKSSIDMIDFEEEQAQFKDIKDSFHDIPPDSYPLVITFHKFLMMLDGTLGNSYFERFLDATKFVHSQLNSSRSVAMETFIRTKEVHYEKFSSSYWPRFNNQLTKMLDASRVFTEIISHIKGGLGSLEAVDGKLSREDYVQLSEGRVSKLTKKKREAIYDIYMAYEKLKMENGEFDLADFVIDLHRRLRFEKYGGNQMDFVYIDEVQDLTMSQIALFKHVCNNVEEGFVFSGDTAQTIARGIDFRFQDIRHLFYKKFVLESRSTKHDERKEKGHISEIFLLTQNFRTHAGILKLSHSIVQLLYRFFPSSIDILKPETSLIYGEAPVLLESEENENAIIKIFGNRGNVVGFGAEQVILVRDDGARKEISTFVGKHALVLTIMECKGLEFQDVLLYNFFGSSPLKNQWRVIYEYTKEQELLDSTLPQRFPTFDEAKHNILCSELKQLYVAVTRTRQRLWVCENVEEPSKPLFDYWKKKCLVQVRQLDDSLAQAMQVASSSEEWKSRGIKLYLEHNYERATMCFERAGDTYWESRSKAAGLKATADRMRTSNPQEANSYLREAAEIFDDIGKADSAARCYFDLGEYNRAARLYLDKCGELEKAGECFSLAGCYEDAADAYAKGNFFSECLSVCAKRNFFKKGLKHITYWKQHAIEDYAVAKREGVDKIEQEFLESCAFHYHQLKDKGSMMKFVRAFQSVILMRNFLKKLGSLDELLLLEDEFGNYQEAAKIAKQKGDILLLADFLEKAGKFLDASSRILLYVLANSLWSDGNKGWPLKQFSQKEGLLSKAKSCAEKESESFYGFVCTEVDILLNKQSNLAVIRSQMNACQRHNSLRGEIFSARKILDAHISSSPSKYAWEEDLAENQVSMDSLSYFWNLWRDKIAQVIEYLRSLENQDVNEYNSYAEFCFSYLGVWRLYHNMSPVYVLLISNADWVRGLDRRYFENHGKLVSIDAHHIVSAAREYWSSEVLSIGVKILDKLDALYKLPIKNVDSVFFHTKCLFHIYDVSLYLLQSENLKRRSSDTQKLQSFLSFSTETLFGCISPLKTGVASNPDTSPAGDSLAHAIQVASSSEEWKSRGIKLYHEHNFERATMCFERAGDTYWESRSKAAGLKATADRMRTSNPQEANSYLREAAEIFDDIGKADSAARCYFDLGEYKRAARLYLDKCGELEKAGECFSLAGCYEDAADAYAKGNFFSECLSVCAKRNFFKKGLKHITYWKQHAIEDYAVAKREGVDKIEQEFLESCAFHYHQLKDKGSMMKFVRAFQSVILMRNFLKKLGSLDELLLLEDEFENYQEAAKIAKQKGDILLEADFLEKAGKFLDASSRILLYVLANSLWSDGNKGWPLKQFSQKKGLLSKAKSCAEKESEGFYGFVCTEVDILLNKQSNLAVIRSQMNACQRHNSLRGEIFSARKILDAHISSSPSKYVWEEDLAENQVSMDSLSYFWNLWRDKIAQVIEYLRSLENQDVNEYNSYAEFCFSYLGVWRLYHNMSPVYVLLISNADWVRGLDRRYFENHGKLVSIDAHHIVSAAREYWSSEVLSIGMKILDKLDALYKLPINNADSVFFHTKCLTHIYDVSLYLLQSENLKRRSSDTQKLQSFLCFSTETLLGCISPLKTGVASNPDTSPADEACEPSINAGDGHTTNDEKCAGNESKPESSQAVHDDASGFGWQNVAIGAVSLICIGLLKKWIR